MSQLVAELKSPLVVDELWALDEDQTDPGAVALSQDRETFDPIVRPIPEGTAETGASPASVELVTRSVS